MTNPSTHTARSYVTGPARATLIDEIATMIGHETYNYAPINYTIAEKALELVETHYKRIDQAK